MDDWRRDRIGAAERGANPMVVVRMSSGFAFVGDTQFLPGSCVLLAAPRMGHLSDPSFERRARFLFDMSLLGEAIERACRHDGLRRVNYEILGNTDAYLHAHVFPRYDGEPTEHAAMPVWLYPRDRWTDSRFAYSAERHGMLRRQIIVELTLQMRAERSEGVDELGGSRSVLAPRAGGAPR